MLLRTLLAGLCLAVTLPTDARAEVHGGADLEMGFARWDDVTILAPQISGWLGINQRARVEASFGFSHVDIDGVKRLELGNPYLGAAFTLPTTRARSFAGLGVALPVASLPDEFRDLVLGSAALAGALQLRALRDSWLWYPDTLTVVVSGGAASAATQGGFEASISGDAAVLIATKTADRDKAELAIQLVGTGAYVMSRAFRAGVDLVAVWSPTEGDDDNFQLSVEPFVRVGFGAVSARVGLTLPIDEPLGPPFDEKAGWGLRFGVGFAL
ncbi:MAG: hypothetical protein R3F39_20380 [Myxococcota bacterium]